MKRRREGTVGRTRYENGERAPSGNGFSGLSDFLDKAELLAIETKATYSEETLMGQLGENLLTQVRRINQELKAGATRQTVYRGISAAFMVDSIHGELRADKKRTGLTVQTYLEARDRARSAGGRINRAELARLCGMAPKNLRAWEKRNIVVGDSTP